MTHRMISEPLDFLVNCYFKYTVAWTASLYLKDSPGIFDALEFINRLYFTLVGHPDNTEPLGCVFIV